MSRHRKLTTICAAVVLSLGLAACGGGGGGSPQTDNTNNAANEAKALADAQKAAKDAADAAVEAAKNARQKAMDARAAANTLKELAPNTDSATEADTAATNAEKAATTAEDARDDAATANTAAKAATKSSDAKGHQADAEKAQKTAEDALDTAADEYDTANSALNAVQTPMITAARTAASKAAKEAKDAYDAAKQSATDAREKANDARDAANQAKDARTGYAEANTQATAAETAADKAEAARDKAKTAWDNAEAAVDAADAATTAKDARAQADIAEDERDEAVEQQGTASTEYDTADTAAGKATTASSTHVLGLLMAANDVDETNAKTRAAEVEKVVMSIAAAAASTGSRNDSRTSGEATATVVWDENVEATDDAAAVTNYLKVTIAGAGDPSIVSETRPSKDNSDPPDGDFTDDGDILNNADEIDGLPGFTHGQHITVGDRHVIVFTDKVQDTAPVTAKDPVSAMSLTNEQTTNNTITKVGAMSGTTIPGVTYYQGSVSDDTDPNTAFTGSLTCPTPTTLCSITVGGTSENPTYTVVGYLFTGSRSASPAVVGSTGVNNDYLAFGVWMDEDGSTDEGNQPDLGAFADGGSIVNADIDNVTGTATYRGAAAGVYTQGKAVDYFHADATLTADFGKKPTSGIDAVNGTVKGTIDNIMAGGMATGDVITLGGAKTNNAIADAATIGDDATFSGMAHMGSGTTKNNITTYKYEGSWSGSFYNADKEPDPDPNSGEIDVAPLSAAGTFGVTGETGTGDAAVTTSYVGAFGAHKQ